ncbi:MAG: polysaccharide deacetylase family protein [Beijerinckiaceae bacterium]|nr:polysaccharide deacetylase family protein [Beijerinckiaceae bacterium]
MFLAPAAYPAECQPGLLGTGGALGTRALGTGRTIAVGAPGGLHAGLKSYAQTIALRDKEVVLTFDDGPLPATTVAVLNALKKECVKATFFLIGRNAKANPQLVRRQIAEGHTVGHHSWSHPHITLRGLSGDAAVKDIIRGIAAVEQVAYGSKYTGGVPRVPFFRFPGFADTAKTKEWLDPRGIAVFGTDLWASDWTPMAPKNELGLILRRLDKKRRGIILFHDTQRATAAMLPAFLRALKAKGYTIVHLVPGAVKPAMEQAGPGWRSETEATLARIMPRVPRGRSTKN